jgi:DNA-binding CsgD family transcriptional regulator
VKKVQGEVGVSRPYAKRQDSEIYEDRGCEVSTKCLKCPLPVCKHDDPGPYQNWKREKKYAEIISEIQRGDTTAVIAARHGYAVSHIAQIKARMRRQEPQPRALRRMEVLAEIKRGDSTKDIAKRHGVSRQTIGRYQRENQDKVNGNNIKSKYRGD